MPQPAWAELLDDWFADTVTSPAAIAGRRAWWFGSDPGRDAHLAKKYTSLVEQCAAGAHRGWLRAAEGRLALVIALDQLPRNLFRGTARAFAYDALTAAWCLAAVQSGQDLHLAPIQRVFLYMPLQHFEDPVAQEAGVELFARLARDNPEWPEFDQGFLAFARQHRDLIERFGRFPHRNRVLGRENTPAEAVYLESGAPTFGQG